MGCFDVFCMLCGGPLGCNFDDPQDDQYAFYNVKHHADALQSCTAWLNEVCVLTRTGLVRNCVYEDYGRCATHPKRGKGQREYFVVTRQNWCAEKGETAPGIPIHAACYALLVAHLPGAKALAESEGSDVAAVESRAVAVYVFEFAEKHLAQECCYTLDCLCVEPLEKAHEQFFTFHHAMLWALCTPARPSLSSLTGEEASTSSSNNSNKRTTKSRGKKNAGALTLDDFSFGSPSPLIAILPPLFESEPQSCDLACFNGMNDIFDALVLDHWCGFNVLALLGQLSKSFYFHVAKQWKKVVRFRHPVLFAEITRLCDVSGVSRFAATDNKEESDALDWHRLMITLVSRYELFAIMRTCGNAVVQDEWDAFRGVHAGWTIATPVKAGGAEQPVVEEIEEEKEAEGSEGEDFSEGMDVEQSKKKRPASVRQLEILKKYQKSQRKWLGPESGDDDGDFEQDEEEDEEEEESEELSEAATLKLIGPLASNETQLVCAAFEEYGVRSWLRMCVLIDVVVSEVHIYESTELIALARPSLATPKYQSLDAIMNPPNRPTQPRTRLEFRKLQREIAELHRKEGGACTNLIDTDLATNSVVRSFRRKMIRYDAKPELKRSCALCNYNLCWHMMCQCGFGLCTQCYFLYDIFFVPETNENAAELVLPEKKTTKGKASTNKKKRKVDNL